MKINFEFECPACGVFLETSAGIELPLTVKQEETVGEITPDPDLEGLVD